MRWIRFLLICLLATGFLGSARVVRAQFLEAETVQAAVTVLSETMATPGHRIPQAMLADAYGVAIIPNVIKGGFVVGARHGRGVLFVRDADGLWHAPVFITLTGGNIGWQVGLQSSDIILVLKTQRSVNSILAGRLTLGADAAAAAGPLGRQAAMATDGQLKAEIYTYSRSRGLFAGVSIDGSVIRIDRLATGAYYRSGDPRQAMRVPPLAQQLTQTIANYAGVVVEPAEPAEILSAPEPSSTTSSAQLTFNQDRSLVQKHLASDADVLRAQLTELAPELYELLDPAWKSYLALPASLFLTGEHPTADELASTVQHFDAVAGNPRFQQLASRPEFQSVYGILKHYRQTFMAAPATLNLPPPPDSNTTVR